MYTVESLVQAMLKSDNQTILMLGNQANNNEITDRVRDFIACLSKEERVVISQRLEKILSNCYFHITPALEKLSKQELFYLKESLIYYIGRISKPDITLLKKIYSVEENKHLLLNIAFSSLITGDEEIETDFISRIVPGNEYDNLIRSWTMAFFANSDNPYSYVDTGVDDWSLAKKARLKRLSINDNHHPKFNKAKAFRWLDLTIIDLFLENRGAYAMSSNDYKIVVDTKINLEGYSDTKIKKMTLLKSKIVDNNPY